MIRLVTGFAILFLLSCSSKTAVPEGIVPVKKMQDIMWDMMRADMLVNTQAAKDTGLNRLNASTALYQQIFKIYHLNKEEFKRSVQYYRTRPDLLQPVFDSLYNKSTAVHAPLPPLKLQKADSSKPR